MRQRYDGFLSATYSPNDIYIRSTDVDRTLTSAYSNLAGLYPPRGDQIWNPKILWQPIPVHTLPVETDYIIGATILNCPKYDRLYAAQIASPEFTSFVQKFSNLSSYIAVNSNYPPSNQTLDLMNQAATARDTLLVEQAHGMSLPSWTNSLLAGTELNEFVVLMFDLPAYTTDLARIRVGYFLQEILDRSQAKANGTLSPNLKIYAYSAHDLNISTILFGLRIIKVCTHYM